MGSHMNARNSLARLLRTMTECIESSTAEEFDSLLRGQGRLCIEQRAASQTGTPRSTKTAMVTKNWSKIAEELRTLPSRDEGQKLIENLSLGRSDLERLARTMGLPVTKQDNAERLRQKIIESSIGSRLSSQAIRGE